jgi:hypothetical protein
MATNLSTALQQVSRFNEGTYSNIQCSWFREMLVTLEGQGTTFLDLSLEAHHSWPNGIFHNSRFLQLVVRDGSRSVHQQELQAAHLSQVQGQHA